MKLTSSATARYSFFPPGSGSPGRRFPHRVPPANRKRRYLFIFLQGIAVLAALVLCMGCSQRNPPSILLTATDTPDTTEIPDTPIDPTYDEIFDDATPHEFIIEISLDEWEGITQDMLDYAKKFPVVPFYDGDGREFRTDNYRKADFIYRRADGTAVKLTKVGIRSRGNESRRLPYRDGYFYKSHFKVKFDETFDMPANDSATEVLNKRRFVGLKALNFKWSRYNKWDKFANKSKINELFSYSLLSEIGIKAPRMSMGTLKFRIAGTVVNYGLYCIVEPVDKPFLMRQYGAADGDLYKCLNLVPGNAADLTEESIAGDNVGVKNVDENYRPSYDLKTNETTSSHAALRDFVHRLNTLEGQQFVDYMDANFDIESFIRYLAMGIYINNLDDYRFLANNYYLFFNTGGKIEFIPYDFDISLGTNWHGEMAYNKFINQDIYNTTNLAALFEDNSPHPLVDKVLAVEKYREQYVNYLKEYILPANKHFLFSEYKAKFDQLFELYRDKTGNDTEDPDPMGLAGYEQKYFFDKTRNVLDQLQLGYSGYELE